MYWNSNNDKVNFYVKLDYEFSKIASKIIEISWMVKEIIHFVVLKLFIFRGSFTKFLINWFLKQKRVFCHLSMETKGFSHRWKYVQQVIQLSRYSSYQTFLKFSSKMNFSDILKYADITPVLKKMILQRKVTASLLVPFLISQRYFIKNWFI